MGTVGSCEMLIHACQATRDHIPIPPLRTSDHRYLYYIQWYDVECLCRYSRHVSFEKYGVSHKSVRVLCLANPQLICSPGTSSLANSCSRCVHRSRSGTNTHFIPPYTAPCCNIIARLYIPTVGFSWANSFCLCIPGPHRVSSVITLIILSPSNTIFPVLLNFSKWYSTVK
jgi:hypothetical protein